MARPLRIEFAGATYHITSRGNERKAIFRGTKDRENFLRLLGLAATRFGWSITAWVLMSNHFHLVLETPEPNLSRGMQWINGTYASWFNRTHKRSGHLFQGRFHGVLVEKESHLADVLRYVVLNPVRAKMVARPEDYRWSSYEATVGLAEVPPWFDVDAAMSMFGGNDPEGRMTYRSFVEAKINCEDLLWNQVTNAIYLGTEEWTKRMRQLVESKPRSNDFPRVQRAVGRPKMAVIVSTVASIARIDAETVRSTKGGAIRQLAAWLGWNEGLLTLRSIAAGLRLGSPGYVSHLIRRCEREFSVNPPLLAQLDAALAALRT
ncbi:MAG: transposase [Acidobacteriota bacterium]